MKVLSKFLFLALLLSSASYLSAQFGVKAGVNLANASIDDESMELAGKKSKLGFSVGVFYQIKSGEKLTIQPELNFIQHGTKFELDFLGNSIESTVGFNYLQLPVLFKYGFGNMDAVNFFVQGGPYAGMGIGKISTKSCIDGECETEDGEYGDGEDGPKKMDFGLQLGGGVNLNKNFSVDVRYILGLANLTSGDGTFKQNGINLNVGYKFGM